MTAINKNKVRENIRERYAGIAQSNRACGCGSGCCQPDTLHNPETSARLGYSAEDLAAVPEGANGTRRPSPISNPGRWWSISAREPVSTVSLPHGRWGLPGG